MAKRLRAGGMVSVLGALVGIVGVFPLVWAGGRTVARRLGRSATRKAPAA